MRQSEAEAGVSPSGPRGARSSLAPGPRSSPGGNCVSSPLLPGWLLRYFPALLTGSPALLDAVSPMPLPSSQGGEPRPCEVPCWEQNEAPSPLCGSSWGQVQCPDLPFVCPAEVGPGKVGLVMERRVCVTCWEDQE